MTTPIHPRLLVLFSVKEPTSTSNPFITLLEKSVDSYVDVEWFSWSRALLGSYGAFHIHWPENLYRARGRVSNVSKVFLALCLIARWKITRQKVIWTVHNESPHEKRGLVDGWVGRLVVSSVTDRVYMNTAHFRPSKSGSYRSYLIPHGHYRDVLENKSHPAKLPGSILTFGLLRPYKGIEDLIQAFADIEESNMTLRIVGSIHSTDYLASLKEAIETSGADDRIEFQPRHLEDAELEAEIRTHRLIVLPYKRMGNSGALLLALSAGAIVLVPRNKVTEALQDEVGSDWVHLFDGKIRAADLEVALRAPLTSSLSPDLSKREWPVIGRSYADIYLKGSP